MVAAPFLSNQAALVDFIKRELGSPVVNLEITPLQIQDQINKALQKFMEVAYGGVQQRLSFLTTVVGQTEYQLPYDVLSVLRAYTRDEVVMGFGTSTDLFSVNQYLAIDILKGGFTQGSLLSIEAFNQWSASIDVKLGIKTDFEYNTATKNFYLWEKPRYASVLALITYQSIDPLSEEDKNIFDHKWIKAYSTEMSRRQWAYNLMKYDGSALPAGLTMNVQGILAEAKENIERLELDLNEMYQLPADFFTG